MKRDTSQQAAEVKEARMAAWLSQEDAAALIYTTPNTWRKWEDGSRRMHPAFWELWCVKSGAKTDAADAAREAFRRSKDGKHRKKIPRRRDADAPGRSARRAPATDPQS